MRRHHCVNIYNFFIAILTIVAFVLFFHVATHVVLYIWRVFNA